MKDMFIRVDVFWSLLLGCISAKTRIGESRTKNMTKSLAFMQGFFSSKGLKMPNDILYDAAHAFSKMLEYDYHFILGDSKRQKTFSIISNEKDMFTHICGIDHLKDIPKVTARKSSEKIAILKNILGKKITFSDISESQHLYEKMSSKQNPITNSEYTIFDRISHLSFAESILDGCEKGFIYRWNNGAGGQRQSKIRADYVLAVPSNNHPEEFHYFFLVVTEDFKRKNNKDKSTPIKTKIISAFSDRDDFLGNLSKQYTILEVSKIEVKTKKIVFTKTHPAYQKEKDKIQQDTVCAASSSKPTQMHIFDENIISKSYSVQGNGTIALAPQAPQSDFFTRIANALVNGLDSIVHKASMAFEKLNVAATKALNSLFAPEQPQKPPRASQSRSKGKSPTKAKTAEMARHAAPAKQSEQKQEKRSSVLADLKTIRTEQAQDKPERSHQRSKSNNREL